MSTLLNQEYYLSKDVGSIASRNYITLNEDNTVSDGVKLMRNSDTSSIIITNRSTQQPTGIVTERDILYRVIGAICIMRNRYVRRLLVYSASLSLLYSKISLDKYCTNCQ
jgi:CBS domain-containing protein